MSFLCLCSQQSAFDRWSVCLCVCQCVWVNGCVWNEMPAKKPFSCWSFFSSDNQFICDLLNNTCIACSLYSSGRRACHTVCPCLCSSLVSLSLLAGLWSHERPGFQLFRGLLWLSCLEVTVSAVLLFTDPVSSSETAAHYSTPNWHTPDRLHVFVCVFFLFFLCFCLTCLSWSSCTFYFEDRPFLFWNIHLQVNPSSECTMCMLKVYIQPFGY